MKKIRLLLIIAGLVLFPIKGADWASQRHLYTKGLLDSVPKEKQIYSPSVGMALLEGELGKKICEEGKDTLRGQLAGNLLHNLNGNLRSTALKRNPFYSVNADELGLLIKMLLEGKTIEDFVKTPAGNKWREEHKARGGSGKMGGTEKFTTTLKKYLPSLDVLDPLDKARVFSMFAAAQSKNPDDLATYGSIVTEVPLKSEKFDLEKMPVPDAVTAEDLIPMLINLQLSAYQKLISRKQLYATYKDHSIPICVEQSVWGLVNLILYNPMTNELDLSLLPKDIIVSEGLKGFIEENKNLDVQDYYNEERANAFMSLVSDIRGIAYVKEGSYEMESSIENGLKIMNYLFGLSAETVEQVGEQLSTVDRKVSLKKVLNESIVQVYVNDPKQNYHVCAEWGFSDMHGYLELEPPDKDVLVDYIPALIKLENDNPQIPLGSLASDLFAAALKDPAELKRKGFENRTDLLRQILALPSADFNKINVQALPLLAFLLREDDLEAAQVAVDYGADVNTIDHYYAVRNNEIDKVLFLLNNGGGANVYDILCLAIEKGYDNEAMREGHYKIIDKAASLATPEVRKRAIEWSILNGRRNNSILYLLDYPGSDLEAAWQTACDSGENGRLFLRELSLRGAGPQDPKEKIDFLLKQGFELGQLLNDAVDKNRKEEIEYLSTSGVDLRRGLNRAIVTSNEPMIRFMIENKQLHPINGFFFAIKNKIDPMIQFMFDNFELDLTKENALKQLLDEAVKADNNAVVSKLLDKKVKPTSLMLSSAVKNNNVEMARLLIQHGAEVQNSMMSGALKHNNKALIDLLDQHGTKPTAQDLDKAARENNLERVKRLIEMGATVEPIIEWGRPKDSEILKYPLEHNNREMVGILRAHGAKREPLKMWLLRIEMDDMMKGTKKAQQIKKMLKETDHIEKEYQAQKNQ